VDGPALLEEGAGRSHAQEEFAGVA